MGRCGLKGKSVIHTDNAWTIEVAHPLSVDFSSQKYVKYRDNQI
jgi:hypothetical protein